MIDYIGLEDCEQTLIEFFTNVLHEEGSYQAHCDIDIESLPFTISEEDFDAITDNYVFSINEGLIEDYVHQIAQSINTDMGKYLHQSDHSIVGNFNNVERDFENDHEGCKFSELIFEIEYEGAKANEYREWLLDWFYDTFGSFGLKYNFIDFTNTNYYEWKIEFESAVERNDTDWFIQEGYMKDCSEPA